MKQTDDNRREIRALFNLITAFRKLDPDMPMTQAICLLWVALNEGRTQVELRQALDMPSATSSRSLAALSKVYKIGKPGLDLIEWVENPEDRRAKLLFLTTKGRKVIDQLLVAAR
ncbi:hypothetical protein MACH18_12920 [Phaeobacter italicus]|uniref:MarR family winged helix-turn-helix transcriptional regulator n=1 Tax=Phaeobacter italicus TaxID=481446 RepID=UPI0027581623|nr:MarR family winged helix-turn-helix transcriptional regulator [Phaeobacter italicus]GLO74212.1 hypothetical protein MACH18_12920 [Phaeobacter italicus]